MAGHPDAGLIEADPVAEPEAPSMPGAGDRAVIDHALREGRSGVGASVVEGVDGIAVANEHDRPAIDLDGEGPTPGHVLEGRDPLVACVVVHELSHRLALQPLERQRSVQDRLPPRRPPSRVHAYLVETRRPLHSLSAIAPLVLAHAALTWLFEPPVSAAAALWVQWPLVRMGLSSGMAAVVLAALFVLAGIALSYREIRGGHARFKPLLLPWIWAEGCAWGLVLHLAWNGIGRGTAGGDGLGVGDNLALALGAGIYEELVFRVVVFWLVRKALDLAASSPPKEVAALGRTLSAVLLTSLIFASAHHFGPEPFSWDALLFRTVAAVVFTSLFAWRGLGVAACAHAAYDVFVVAL